MLQGRFVHVAQIFDQRARAGLGQRQIINAKSMQGSRPKMIKKGFPGALGLKRPVAKGRKDHILQPQHGMLQKSPDRLFMGLGKETFIHRDLGKDLKHLVRCSELIGLNSAGRGIGKGQPPVLAVQRKGDQITRVSRIIQECAGGDHPDDIPADDALGQRRILYLFTDRDFLAGTDQAADVIFRGMIRNPAHGDLAPGILSAGGQDQIQDLGSGLGILVEHLVKIPQTEKKDTILMGGLDLSVLAKHGRGRFHSSLLYHKSAFQRNGNIIRPHLFIPGNRLDTPSKPVLYFSSYIDDKERNHENSVSRSDLLAAFDLPRLCRTPPRL